jgi:succinate dehydrogenase / fumarate reductase flavoprotein subunit
MYERITGEDPYTAPMRIYPAPHYTMGGLWVDYNLQSTITGLFVGGEANFSDHGANRLGASALMQGLADGYFVLPATIPDYLAAARQGRVDVTHPAFQEAKQAVAERINKLLSMKGERTVESIYRELGTLMWNNAGMARSDESLHEALERIPSLREQFWTNVCVAGQNEEINQSLERAGRVADFLELAELLCIDALHRTESCGAHFRIESQTEDGEALRDDENFAYVAAWQYGGEGKRPLLRKEPLEFENVHLAVRSYK